MPDIDEAVEWFQDVIGAVRRSLRADLGSQGTLMQDLLGVDPRTVIDQITMLRVGHSANIELFQYEAPDQRHNHPRNSDWSGHHIAFYVTDIDAAVAYMDAKGVERFFGPFTLTAGPAAGQSINYFKTPFGTYIELISYPDGMAYQVPSVKPLWSPKLNGATPEVTTVPGLLGIDHIGITVPDVAAAAAWFARVLGGNNPLTFGPFSRPDRRLHAPTRRRRPARGRRRDQDAPRRQRPRRRAVPVHGARPGASLPKNSDWGAHHIAFYVRNIDKAVDYLQSKGAQTRLGPFAVTAGPAAGQTINYVRTPFGTDIELISYPHGMAYQRPRRAPLGPARQPPVSPPKSRSWA